MEHFYPQCNRFMRASIGLPIELKTPADKSKMGVYFLWFGEKYYIGSTKNLFKRAVGHQITLNRLIDDVKVGSASTYNILKHVFTDLTVERGIMDLVYEAEDEQDLVSAEGMYLRDSVEDPNCLNHSQKPLRPLEKRHYPMVDSVKTSVVDSINECVFKLFYKDKFVIVKGKSFVGSLKHISRSIEDFSKKDQENWPSEHLYYHFIAFILQEGESTPEFKSEVLLVTNNAFELLKKEQEQLWEHKENQLCLNNAVDSYIPTYKEETGMYGWINKGHLLAFMRWKKRNMPPSQEPASYDPLDQTDSQTQEEES